MSLYNLVKGTNLNAGICLAMLQLDPSIIPRLRDAWLADDGLTITVLTRTGGGNRDDYAENNAALSNIPGYLGDKDDDFDSTFAHFRFAVPDQFKNDTALIAEVMKLVGKGEGQQGPGMLLSGLEGNSKSSPQIENDDPRIQGAADAHARICDALQQQMEKVNG